MKKIEDNLLDMESEFEKKVLEDQIVKLQETIVKLEIILKENDIEYTASDVSDEEAICVQQIGRLLELSEAGPLSADDVKKFDILNKNLQLIRGNLKRGKKTSLKGMSTEDLKKQLKK